MYISRQHRIDPQFPSRFFASLQVVNHAIQWLAGLMQLTEAEQKQAGIYLLGSQGHE